MIKLFDAIISFYKSSKARSSDAVTIINYLRKLDRIKENDKRSKNQKFKIYADLLNQLKEKAKLAFLY